MIQVGKNAFYFGGEGSGRSGKGGKQRRRRSRLLGHYLGTLRRIIRLLGQHAQQKPSDYKTGARSWAHHHFLIWVVVRKTSFLSCAWNLEVFNQEGGQLKVSGSSSAVKGDLHSLCLVQLHSHAISCTRRRMSLDNPLD